MSFISFQLCLLWFFSWCLIMFYVMCCCWCVFMLSLTKHIHFGAIKVSFIHSFTSSTLHFTCQGHSGSPYCSALPKWWVLDTRVIDVEYQVSSVTAKICNHDLLLCLHAGNLFWFYKFHQHLISLSGGAADWSLVRVLTCLGCLLFQSGAIQP